MKIKISFIIVIKNIIPEKTKLRRSHEKIKEKFQEKRRRYYEEDKENLQKVAHDG